MTRSGNTKSVDRAEWSGRWINAKAFLASARDSLQLADDTHAGNPIMSNALLAAIAYADALTIKAAGVKNTTDHGRLPTLVEHVLQRRAEPAQIVRLRRIVAHKNDIQYADDVASVSEARDYVEQVERFAGWAEQVLPEL